MQKLIAKIPEVFEDDDRLEQQRADAIRTVRTAIAQRWCEIFSNGEGHPKFQEQVADMNETLAGFIEIHGSSFSFPPEPLSRCKGFEVPDTKANSDVTSQTSSWGSSSSKGEMIPHEFRFLQHRDHSVWTVLQACGWKTMLNQFEITKLIIRIISYYNYCQLNNKEHLRLEFRMQLL